MLVIVFWSRIVSTDSLFIDFIELLMFLLKITIYCCFGVTFRKKLEAILQMHRQFVPLVRTSTPFILRRKPEVLKSPAVDHSSVTLLCDSVSTEDSWLMIQRACDVANI